jgi:DnaJ domain
LTQIAVRKNFAAENADQRERERQNKQASTQGIQQTQSSSSTMDEANEDPYEILGLRPDCTTADVKKQYRKLALKVQSFSFFVLFLGLARMVAALAGQRPLHVCIASTL